MLVAAYGAMYARPGASFPSVTTTTVYSIAPVLPQDGHGLRHGGRALADRTVDTEHVLPALVQDGVDRNGRLARLAIAENQFALAAPDGNERIDDLQTGLQRHGDRRAVHDGGAGRSMGQPLAGGHRPVTIERATERIDDASQQSVAHGHVHHAAGALDGIARVQVPVVAEQDDADLVLVHVEGDAEHAAGKCDQLLEADAGKAGDRGDAGGDGRDRADLAWRQLGREGSPRLADAFERAVEDALQAVRRVVHGLVVSGVGLQVLAEPWPRVRLALS